MIDKYKAHDDVSSPARKPYSITPVASANSTNMLFPLPKALYIGEGGDVALSGEGGSIVLFKNVPDGSILPVRAEYVYSSNTTANSIIALV